MQVVRNSVYRDWEGHGLFYLFIYIYFLVLCGGCRVLWECNSVRVFGNLSGVLGCWIWKWLCEVNLVYDWIAVRLLSFNLRIVGLSWVSCLCFFTFLIFDFWFKTRLAEDIFWITEFPISGFVRVTDNVFGLIALRWNSSTSFSVVSCVCAGPRTLRDCVGVE